MDKLLREIQWEVMDDDFKFDPDEDHEPTSLAMQAIHCDARLGVTVGWILTTEMKDAELRTAFYSREVTDIEDSTSSARILFSIQATFMPKSYVLHPQCDAFNLEVCVMDCNNHDIDHDAMKGEMSVKTRDGWEQFKNTFMKEALQLAHDLASNQHVDSMSGSDTEADD